MRSNRGGLTKKFNAEYKTWHAMKCRCYRLKDGNYHRYGGRGIKVCDEWLQKDGFERFLEYVGPRPTDGHSLDRINNDGNYEPGNVRWATAAEQNRNRSNSHFLEFNGKRQTVYDWSVETGINEQTLHERLKRGWSIENTLTVAVRLGKEPRIILTHQGKSLSISQWAVELNISEGSIRQRYDKGLPVEKILSTEPLRRVSKSQIDP